jgi:hypothetical protein
MTTALMLLALSAHAAPVDAYDLHGHAVSLAGAPTLLVFWSMDCGSCAADLARLERVDVRLIAVNTDPLEARARLLPWLAAHGLHVDVVADTTGDLRSRFAVSGPVGAVATTSTGEVAWRSQDLDVDARLVAKDAVAKADTER